MLDSGGIDSLRVGVDLMLEVTLESGAAGIEIQGRGAEDWKAQKSMDDRVLEVRLVRMELDSRGHRKGDPAHHFRVICGRLNGIGSGQASSEKDGAFTNDVC